MMIYVITHKVFKFKKYSDIYRPLLVGADYNVGEEDYARDNNFIGNISAKNKTFCELTGMYWIWKQSQERQVGICHYRRYFCKNKRWFKKSSILKRDYIGDTLANYDVILPRKGNNEYNGYTAKEFFGLQHDMEVWDSCKNIIKQQHPEFLADFEWFENELTGYCYNMMIISKDKYDQYNQWLFDILFQLEKTVDITKYTDYNTRMFGFVAERLLNVWVHHHQYKVKELPIYFTEENPLYKKAIRKIRKHRTIVDG